MSRDRLLPPVFSAVSERFGSPYHTTIATGVAVAPAVGLIVYFGYSVRHSRLAGGRAPAEPAVPAERVKVTPS